MLGDMFSTPDRESYLRLAQQVSRVGFFEWDLLSNCLLISERVLQMFGQGHEGFHNNPKLIIKNYVHPDFQDLVHEAARKLLEEGRDDPLELKVLNSDGIEYWVRAKAEINGQRILGVIQDITELKYQERILALKDVILEINHAVTGNLHINDFFSIILEKVFHFVQHADMGTVLVLDQNNNLRIAASLGYDEKKAQDFRIKLEDSFIWHQSAGKLEKTIIIDDVNRLVQAGFPQMLENNKGYTIKSTISSPIFLNDQLFGLLNIDSRVAKAFDGTDWEMMEYSRNQIAIAVSKHKLYEETIYLSRHDKLTGIYNRRYFEELLFTQLQRAARYQQVFSFAVFDLNNLKTINDTYGHLAGDELIRHFARTLRMLCRSSDFLARYGGDEFVAVFPETMPEGIMSKLAELRHQFQENPLAYEGNYLTCSFSYGLAFYPTEGTTYDQLVKVADKRMYQHKRKQGK